MFTIKWARIPFVCRVQFRTQHSVRESLAKMFGETRKVESLVPPAKYTRFHLPGFTLPLDWKPHGGKRDYRHENGQSICYELGPEGYGEELFPTALDSEDHEGGYSRYDFGAHAMCSRFMDC